jgi:hypothetical protein
MKLFLAGCLMLGMACAIVEWAIDFTDDYRAVRVLIGVSLAFAGGALSQYSVTRERKD